MKLKSILGAVLAGALALGSTLAHAQAGPIYLTPKLLYSHQSVKSFDSTMSGSVNSHYSSGDRTDNVFGGGLAIGYDFGAVGYTPFRTELEFLARGASEADYGKKISGATYDHSTIATGHSFKTKAYTLFANVYYDFVNDSNLTPYIGGGIGAAYLDTTSKITIYDPNTSQVLERADGNQDGWNFAWNLGGGVAYQISDTTALDLGYRYTDMGEAEASSRAHHTYRNEHYRPHTKADISAHEFILGLRISGY